MASNLIILNPADKTRHYTYASGEGAPVLADEMVFNINKFPVGSQYIDTTTGDFYVRTVKSDPAVVADWKKTTLS